MTAPTSRDPPEDPPARTTVETTHGGAGFLVVKNCNPWFSAGNVQALQEATEDFGVIPSSAFAGYDLSSYHTIILASTQDAAYYNDLVAGSEKLATFVAEGGTLIAHVADQGFPCTTTWTQPFLPRGVRKVNTFPNDLTVTAPTHPAMAGISSGDLDDWNFSSHGYFTGVPEDATVVTTIAGSSRPTYIEYPHCNGLVLATMQTLEWPWGTGESVVPDPAAAKGIIRNEIDFAANRRQEIEERVDVVSFIPGESENTTRGGDPFNSAVAQFFPVDFSVPVSPPAPTPALTLETSPLFDNWGTGDMIRSENYPSDVDAALDPRANKWEEDSGSGTVYKTLNHVDVSFEVEAGEIDESSVEVTFIGENADSVMEQEAVNNLADDISGDVRPNRFTGGYQPRHYKVDRITVDDTDAVRVTTVFGGYTRIASSALELLSRQGTLEFLFETLDWDIEVAGLIDLPEEVLASHFSGLFSAVTDLLVGIPNIFSFFEVVLTIDGRTFVRMWDNSFFPEHAVYVSGDLENILGFPRVEGIRKLVHPNFLLFLLTPSVGLLSPYAGSKRAYFDCVIHDRDCFDLSDRIGDDVLLNALNVPLTPGQTDLVLDGIEELLEQGHPTWTFGVDCRGDEIPESEIESILPDDPVEPFAAAGGQRWSHQNQATDRTLTVHPFE